MTDLPDDLFAHVTWVGTGNGPWAYAAHCDPDPGTGDNPFCWVGPDRETIAEAVADALEHDPTIEPVIAPT